MRDRPASVALLSAMYIAAASIPLVAVVAPPSNRTPTWLLLGAGAVSALIGITLWLLGPRANLRVQQVAVAAGVLLVSVVIARAATGVGEMVAAFMYVWMVVFAAIQFSTRAVVAQTVWIAVCFGVALIVNPLPMGVTPWLIVSVTVVVAATALNRMVLGQRRLAVTDPLTGLVNRTGLWAAADRERVIARRTREPISVALLDLDGFKAVNDAHGHAAGDRLLKELSAAWGEALRARDVLARTGGDEFVVLMPATDLAGADAVLARLRAVRETPWSAGVALWHAEDPLDVALAHADRELYAAKPAAVPA